MKKGVPEFFFTSIRRVEPVGGDCIRIYCSIERGTAWQDCFTALIPVAAAMQAARFMIESLDVLEGEISLAKERAH